MVFSSAIFLFVFLPIVLVLERALPAVRVKNVLLLAASLLFYAFGQPVYLLLLLASVALNHGCGRLAAGRWRKQGVTVAVAGNLALLGVFKYAAFAVSTVNALTGLALPLPDVALPIGISFFTFQGISYVIDVYRGRAQAARSFADVLLYIAFFPQLIAGPIVKYHDIAQQLTARTVTPAQTAQGIERFVCGLAKKLLLSNRMGLLADAVFGLPAEQLGAPAAWMGAVCYTLQIYFDFSGYSDMAIGMGQMFGFRFHENFDYPYTATTIKDFWRRWHISLSTWFRDYLYIPLGGNRRGRARTWANRLIVFFVTGLWHGASWNFVLWGLWHGLFSVLEDCGALPVRRLRGKGLGRVYTLLVVVAGFVLFRADTLPQAGALLAAMLTGWDAGKAGIVTVCSFLSPAFVLCFVLSIILCFPLAKRFSNRWVKTRMAGALALLALCMLQLSAGTFNPFIYFRF